MPIRIQLKRTKGWNLQELSRFENGLPAVKVDRTTRWGNPYKEGITPGNYASWFRADVTKEMKSPEPTADHPWSRRLHAIGKNLHLLRGKNLACWCALTNPDGSPNPCHADVLLDLANK